MNAPVQIDTAPNWRTMASWPERWDATRGTPDETEALMSIAAEAEKRDDDVFRAADDAANARDHDEYLQAAADLEDLFDAAEDDGPYEDLFPAMDLGVGRVCSLLNCNGGF